MRKQPPVQHEQGFTLVMSVAMLFLIALIALSMLGLSSIELRRSSQATDQARARTNARLALMLAIGNLQKQLGPDQRVSAPASQENAPTHPHWTGTWSTTAADGTSLWRRDDANGGLTDLRPPNRLQSVRRWLVSGNDIATNFTPTSALTNDNSVSLVDRGTMGTQAAATDLVRAPLVNLTTLPKQRGRYAYWVGDEGVKANIATTNAYDGKKPNPAQPAEGGYFALLNSQQADTDRLLGSAIGEAEKTRLVSARQVDLIDGASVAKAQSTFHHSTTHSLGVLANTRQGRLKRDLTAFIESRQNFPDLRNGGEVLAPGLSVTDNIVGPANAQSAQREGLVWSATLHKKTSPRFSLIRDFTDETRKLSMEKTPNTNAIPPNSEASPVVINEPGMAMMNNRPSAIASMGNSSLHPVLVEGSFYMTISYYDLPPGGRYAYNIRFHTYPRAVLWNPYNVPITLPPTVLMFQGNGRLEFQLIGPQRLANGSFTPVRTADFFFINTGRNFNYGDQPSFVQSSGYNDPYVGCWYYSLPATTFQPGECLVFSPERSMRYSQSSPLNNRLSCNVAPDVSRDMRVELGNIFDPNNGTNVLMQEYRFGPLQSAVDQNNFRTQSDDQRMILKLVDNNSVTSTSFDSLRQIAAVSCSLQYGAGREPRISWNVNNGGVTAEKLPSANPIPTMIPNVRTREGYRMRWFQEHESNRINAGSLQQSAFFEEAYLANWNPRAAYSVRSPWENIGGKLPTTGDLGGPYFFGLYTRDLYDQAVSWNEQMPVFRNGRYHGNPFGTPQEGRARNVLFDVPRKGVGLLSLAQLQHAKFSEFVWHPSYAFANSLIDPRIATAALRGMNRTAPLLDERANNGFSRNYIGWSNDEQRSATPETWARHGRAYLQDVPTTDLLVYDLSYELNHTVWDDFFLSTGDGYAKELFLRDPVAAPLPNGRMRLNPHARSTATTNRLMDLHQPARHLMVDGAFNVNSTSIDAWEALLRSSKNLVGNKDAVFPRVLNAPGGEWRTGKSANAQDAWDGYRTLNDGEVRLLAEQIVNQVKLRGPFLSLSDFVNRRLRDDETGRMGPLQAAIEAAGLNQAFRSTYPLNNRESLPNYAHPDNIRDATRLEQTMKPDSLAWGVPGYLTQADVLQVIGSTLTARSDTFRIRAYGEATDDNGVPRARAWCEAVVQRMPEPLRPDATGLNSVQPGSAGDFGRRFAVVSFRWLKPEEV